MNIFISEILKFFPFKLDDYYSSTLCRKIRHIKDTKYLGIGREEVKLSLSADHMIISVEILKPIQTIRAKEWI